MCFQAYNESEEQLCAHDDFFKKWKLHSTRTRSKHRLSKDSKAWTSRPDVIGVPPVARMQEWADIAFSYRRNQLAPTATTRDVVRKMWGNLSQSIHWMPMSIGSAPSLARSAVLYNFEEDECLTPQSAMLSMGTPINMVDGLSSSHARDMSGEQFSIPCSTVVHGAIFYVNTEAEWF